MKKYNACDESVTPDGGESFPALKNRVLQVRDTYDFRIIGAGLIKNSV